VWLRRLSQYCQARLVCSTMTSRLLPLPRIPEYWSEPRRCEHPVLSCACHGAWRCSRHHVPLPCLHRRRRFPTVLRLMTQYPRRGVAQEWGHPSKAHVPLPSADLSRHGGLVHSTTTVFAGCRVRLTRPHRFGRTSMTRWASASSSKPRMHSSAQRVRKHRPFLRGCTSLTPHASQT
jgi:hypothetical protein